MSKIKDYFIQDNDPEDDYQILHQEAANVNIRLYLNNSDYRRIIYHVITYMEIILKRFPELSGISAPTIGFPFKIIGIKEIKGIKEEVKFLFNPVITNKSNIKNRVQSNCASVKDKADVQRFDWITIEFHNTKGQKQQWPDIRGKTSNVLQHEIHHIEGIVITDLDTTK